MSAESIWSKPLTKSQRATVKGIAERQERAEVAAIDYTEIPALTEAQLKQFRRPSKKLVAVRLDADILDWLQTFGPGYSTRINNVLRVVMSQGR